MPWPCYVVTYFGVAEAVLSAALGPGRAAVQVVYEVGRGGVGRGGAWNGSNSVSSSNSNSVEWGRPGRSTYCLYQLIEIICYTIGNLDL